MCFCKLTCSVDAIASTERFTWVAGLSCRLTEVSQTRYHAVTYVCDLHVVFWEKQDIIPMCIGGVCVLPKVLIWNIHSFESQKCLQSHAVKNAYFWAAPTQKTFSCHERRRRDWRSLEPLEHIYTRKTLLNIPKFAIFADVFALPFISDGSEILEIH